MQKFFIFKHFWPLLPTFPEIRKVTSLHPRHITLKPQGGVFASGAPHSFFYHNQEGRQKKNLEMRFIFISHQLFLSRLKNFC
jgi:hypothetical protein